MAKSFFKRGEIKPDVAAATSSLVLSHEQEWANNRIGPEITLKALMAVLIEHKVRVWHMPIEGGEVLCFAGGDAPILAKQALAALYGK